MEVFTMRSQNCCDVGYSCSTSQRNFLTKEEKVEMLRDYKATLEKEVKGITEKISSLKKD